MSLKIIHLQKLLKILFLNNNKRRTELRKDIREEIGRESGKDASGGDFYAPFWSDAKSHAFGTADLHENVERRIAANRRSRTALYPRLRDGFLLWWDQRRRWTNEPFRPGQTLNARFHFPGVPAEVKVNGILSVRDGDGIEHFVYPYFAPEPPLSDEAARLGLWLLSAALPEINTVEIRILDVIRGRTFSIDRYPLTGDEEENFRRRFIAALKEREFLRKEYP